MATQPHGGTNGKIERLLAYHEQAAAAIRFTLSLMNGHATTAKTNGHASVLAQALALDDARVNGNGNGHGHDAPAKAAKRARNGEAKQRAIEGRQRAQRTLELFDRQKARKVADVAAALGVPALRLGVGPLSHYGYLKKKGGGFVRTAKPYIVKAQAAEATG
jgi:hypothetical protein